MRFKTRTYTILMTCGLSSILIVSSGSGLGAPQAQAGRTFSQIGRFPSPAGTCIASITVSDLGGFHELAIDKNPNSRTKAISRVRDVTGMQWVTPRKLVYSTSPIYGKPGLYLFDCISTKTKRVVGPRTITKAYPDGADYFELYSGASSSEEKIYFYYGPNVDEIDFGNFRRLQYLHSVRSDGTRFAVVSQPGHTQ